VESLFVEPYAHNGQIEGDRWPIREKSSKGCESFQVSDFGRSPRGIVLLAPTNTDACLGEEP